MNDKALSNAALELTQKIQMHFPRNIAPEVLTTWNGCPVDILTEHLTRVFGVVPILRLISGGEQIVIGATSGTKTIASSTDIFTWGIDPDFENWGLDVPGQATPAKLVQVHEMVQDGDFKTIYGSVGRDLDALCLTQEQIVAFVRGHKKWLRTSGYATLFLFKVADEFFVAGVNLYDDGRPDAHVHRFSNDNVWNAVSRRRIVLPQLTLES